MAQDLAVHEKEYYSKRDLRSGIMLICKYAVEFGGMATVGLMTMKLVAIASGALAPLGLAIGPAVVARIAITAAQGYAAADTMERKQIRAAIRWIKGGFSLGERLVG